MTKLRVTQIATGRSMIGTPDELLAFLGSWWPDQTDDDGDVESLLTQAVYEWEQGKFDGWRNQRLGVTAGPA